MPAALRLPSSVLCLLASLGWLWFVLINQLRLEWSVNPQYAYGWAVPFLCAYLLWQRLTNHESRISPLPFQLSAFSFQFLFWFLAGLYFPIRLIQEANPEWRFVSWALALMVLSLTLLVLGQMTDTGGQRSASRPPSSVLRSLAFPLCFILVAVPWPTLLEGPVIQFLARANAAVTIEILNALGIPALQRGNVIEVSTGLVGIDDACSGIRSLQATLMISLFLGEHYRLNVPRRLALCLAGFGLAFVCNVGRTTLLTWVAAREGVGAIARWHDPAGIIILVGCFLGLWLVALALRRKSEIESQNPEVRSQQSDLRPPTSAAMPCGSRITDQSPPISGSNFQLSTIKRLSPALAAWLLFTEVAVEGWYRYHEQHLGAPVQWTAQFPRDAVVFKDLPFSDAARQILRFDEGKNVQWSDGDTTWQVIYLRWHAGRVAAHLARNHTPEVCLTAAGHQLEMVPEMKVFTLAGFRLPFRVYSLRTERGPVFVYYCLWEDRQRARAFDTEMLTYNNRWLAIREGRRNLGQRSLEVAVSGMSDLPHADDAVQRQLEKIIRMREH